MKLAERRAAFARPATILLAAALLFKGLVWAVTFPPFDPPDEANHYSYAQLLGLSYRLPVEGSGDDYSPDVRALTAATLTPVTPGSKRVRLYPERAGRGLVGPAEGAVNALTPVPTGETPAGRYGPATYGLFAAAIRATSGSGIIAQLMAARVVAVLLGVGAALAVTWAAREAGLSAPVALAAGALVGYQPMLSQQAASVTTDVGTIFYSALALALAVRHLRRPGALNTLAMALAISLALLSKPAAAFALLLLALPLVDVARATREQRPRRIGIAALASGLAVLPFMVWNHYHPGTIPVGTAHGHLRDYVHIVVANGFQYPLSQLDGFWGEFGPLEQSLPDGALMVARGISVAAMAVILVGLIRARGRTRWVSAMGLCMFAVCALIAVGFDVVLWRNQATLGLQGRYLLPGLPGIALAIAVGIQELGRRGMVLAGALVVTASVMTLNAVALLTLWDRFFLA